MIERVTLRDIAKVAGVHYSTVSMALRDHPGVSKKVTSKIKALAASMGYKPDAALSALNAYRKTKLRAHFQSTLAWIDNWISPVQLRDQPTFNEYFLGAQNRASQLGYELEEFRFRREGVPIGRLSNILRSRGIKGLLLAPQPTANTKLPLKYEWFSTVTFGYSLQPRIFHLVTNHQPHSCDVAFANIWALGYKRIGLFVTKDHDDKLEKVYLSGHWRFHQTYPDAIRVEPGLPPMEAPVREYFLQWFQKTRPDAVLGVGGYGIPDWLGELGLRVPEDVGYANLSVAEDDDYISGIYENGRLIGQAAVDFLVGMLQRGEVGAPETPFRVLVEGKWKPGRTLRRQGERGSQRRTKSREAGQRI